MFLVESENMHLEFYLMYHLALVMILHLTPLSSSLIRILRVILLLLETELLLLSSNLIHVDQVVRHKDIRSRTMQLEIRDLILHLIRVLCTQQDQEHLLIPLRMFFMEAMYHYLVICFSRAVRQVQAVPVVGSMQTSLKMFLLLTSFTLRWMAALLSPLNGVTIYLTSKLVLLTDHRLELVTSVTLDLMVYGRSLVMDLVLLLIHVRLLSQKIEQMLLTITHVYGVMKLHLEMVQDQSSPILTGRNLVLSVPNLSELILMISVSIRWVLTPSLVLHTQHMKMHLLVLRLIHVQTLTLLVMHLLAVELLMTIQIIIISLLEISKILTMHSQLVVTVDHLIMRQSSVLQLQMVVVLVLMLITLNLTEHWLLTVHLDLLMMLALSMTLKLMVTTV